MLAEAEENKSIAVRTCDGFGDAAERTNLRTGSKPLPSGSSDPFGRSRCTKCWSTSALNGASFTVIAATKKPDGTFEAARINVGRDGVVP